MFFLKTLSRVISFEVLLGLITLLIASCTSTPTLPTIEQPKTDVYRHDLRVKINGKEYLGVGVIPQSQEYNVVVYPKDRIDRIIWQTCNREEVIDKPKTGWFNDSYQFSFKPVTPIEDQKACALQITVLTDKSVRTGMALFAFSDSRPEVDLPATLKCNGSVSQYPSGVSVCQSAAGLLEQIEFKTPVILSGVKDPNCNIMKKSDDEKVYTFVMPVDKCTYYFVSNERASNGKRRLHRLETVGYNFIPAR